MPKSVFGASDATAAFALAGLLAAAGVTHLTKPGPYDRLVPKALPGQARWWTYGSGVAELAVAAAVALPATRRTGASAAAGLFAAVFPANVKMAWDWRHRGPLARTVAYGRLPVQVPLVVWALAVRRGADGGASGGA
ncbi:hypothetical protein KDL01_35125 [Actinospica durhamensis]|uniref:DoxX family protein n=1 Tax=Actinospica durhamensis TaxID=1508375 RepID=A0A941EWG0_9ACTN|nr:hypothetical protein [Actinospica durhamensis]MBR7838553.1 hypothetical protein [Actinospica durhamensis]